MSETTIAGANVRIAHDKKRNITHLLELVDEAAAMGVDILVLPEMALQGYADFAFPIGDSRCADQKEYYLMEAETIPGPSTELFHEAARRHRMIIQLGLAERALHGNVIFNTTVLIGPDGILSRYRKIHNHFEYPYFGPGEFQSVTETAHGALGSIICYDLCFPELLRSYALQGADLIAMSTAWPMKGHDRAEDYQGWAMDLMAQSNAFCNHCWLVVSNHCEKRAYSQQIDYYGGSQIVDPFGKVVAYLKDEEGLAVHRADLKAAVAKSRTGGFSGLNMLQDRRPEHYRLLVDQSYRYASDDAPANARPERSTSRTARSEADPMHGERTDPAALRFQDKPRPVEF
jgi:predicted amidohydrolase